MRIETQLQIAPSLGDLGSGGSGKTLGGGRLGLGALLGDTCARRCCFCRFGARSEGELGFGRVLPFRLRHEFARCKSRANAHKSSAWALAPTFVLAGGGVIRRQRQQQQQQEEEEEEVTNWSGGRAGTGKGLETVRWTPFGTGTCGSGPSLSC